MPHPTPVEMLSTPELLALREALVNEHLMAGLGKILTFEVRLQAENMEQESLKDSPNVNRIVQYASKLQAARELVAVTIKNRMESLTARQNR
jgi:hypothetical protein